MLKTFKSFYDSKNILIVESNKDEIYQKYYKQIIDQEVFDKITSMFQNNTEVRWIVQAFRGLKSDDEKNRFLNEDMPKLREYFDRLNLLKRKNVAEAKNLNLFSIKSIPELAKSINSIIGSEDEPESQQSSGDWRTRFIGKNGKVLNMEKIFENGEYIVVRPKDKDALGEAARGSEWCVSYDKDNCMIDSYAPEKNSRGNDNRLYLLQNKNNKKKSYLFHFISNQMMDYNDQSMSIDDIQNASPALKEAMMSLLNYPEIKEEILNSSDASLNYLNLIDSLEEGENQNV
jgi:hypothetical protein